MSSYFRLRHSRSMNTLSSPGQALVGVEDLRLAEPGERLLQRRKAEPDIHRVRQPPSQHRTARPVAIQRPRPSIEMRMPAPASMPVKSPLVNWLPPVSKIATM